MRAKQSYLQYAMGIKWESAYSNEQRHLHCLYTDLYSDLDVYTHISIATPSALMQHSCASSHVSFMRKQHCAGPSCAPAHCNHLVPPHMYIAMCGTMTRPVQAHHAPSQCTQPVSRTAEADQPPKQRFHTQLPILTEQDTLGLYGAHNAGQQAPARHMSYSRPNAQPAQARSSGIGVSTAAGKVPGWADW